MEEEIIIITKERKRLPVNEGNSFSGKELIKALNKYDDNGVYSLEPGGQVEWKKGFDDLADQRAQFSRDAKVGKVDDHTAIVVVDVFDPAGMMAMFNSDAAKKMAEEMGVNKT